MLVAIAIGVASGAIWLDFGGAINPLADGFIKLVKMVISSLIFFAIVAGISGMGDLQGVGCVGAKVLGYLLTFSTLALLVGFRVALVVCLSEGMNFDPATLNYSVIKEYVSKVQGSSMSILF